MRHRPPANTQASGGGPLDIQASTSKPRVCGPRVLWAKAFVGQGLVGLSTSKLGFVLQPTPLRSANRLHSAHCSTLSSAPSLLEGARCHSACAKACIKDQDTPLSPTPRTHCQALHPGHAAKPYTQDPLLSVLRAVAPALRRASEARTRRRTCTSAQQMRPSPAAHNRVWGIGRGT